MTALTAFCIAAAVVVMYRTICLISALDAQRFDGHPWRFLAIASHCALVGSGAVAVAFGSPAGGPMLLAGISIMVVADRRKHRR